MTRQVDVRQDFVGGNTLTSSERRDGERIGRVGGWHRAIRCVALRCVGRGSLGTQTGRNRLFLLLFLSPFWPVLGDTMAERCEWRSMAARRWRRIVRSFRVSKLRKSER